MQEGQLGVSSKLERENQTWLYDASGERKHVGDVLESEAENLQQNMGHNPTASSYLNREKYDYVGIDAIGEKEFKFAASALDAEWSPGDPDSHSNKSKELPNAEWTLAVSRKRKKNFKPSGNMNKHASHTWGVGSSSQLCYGDPIEGGIRVPDSNQKYFEGVNQIGHRSWSMTLNGAPKERKHIGEDKEWETEFVQKNMQHDSCTRPQLNGESRDFVVRMGA